MRRPVCGYGWKKCKKIEEYIRRQLEAERQENSQRWKIFKKPFANDNKNLLRLAPVPTRRDACASILGFYSAMQNSGFDWGNLFYAIKNN